MALRETREAKRYKRRQAKEEKEGKKSQVHWNVSPKLHIFGYLHLSPKNAAYILVVFRIFAMGWNSYKFEVVPFKILYTHEGIKCTLSQKPRVRFRFIELDGVWNKEMPVSS